MAAPLSSFSNNGFHQKMLASSVELALVEFERTSDLASLNTAALTQWRKLLETALDADTAISNSAMESAGIGTSSRGLNTLRAILQVMPDADLDPKKIASFIRDLQSTTDLLLSGTVPGGDSLQRLLEFSQQYGNSYDHYVAWERETDKERINVWHQALRHNYS